jgi:hypothetical protein
MRAKQKRVGCLPMPIDRALSVLPMPAWDGVRSIKQSYPLRNASAGYAVAVSLSIAEATPSADRPTH